MRNRYYVVALKAKDLVVGYAVNDCVNGMEMEHISFKYPKYDPAEALLLANQWRDDANTKVA